MPREQDRLGLRPRHEHAERHRARHLVSRSRRSATPRAPPPRLVSWLSWPGPPRRPATASIRLDVVQREIDLDAPPGDIPDAYLRLHLLSHRLVPPHGLQPGRHLRRAAPTSSGRPSGRAPSRTSSRPGWRCAAGARCTCLGVDKFPRMIDYVLPTGVRIADADRVRLGAHLAAGTTVMHEGFVNFNAGTLGTSMVEGRISAGVSSTTAPTSAAARRSWARCPAAARERISIGKRCLIGANAGVGHLARRRLRGRGRLLRHRRLQAHLPGRRRWCRRRSCPAQRDCVTGATA